MFPIILAHGIARFDFLRQKVANELNISPNSLDDELQYFRNIRTYLNSNGFSQVFNTDVEFAGSVSLRAEQLKKQVENVLTKTGAEKVHIIAHSMGGLDARWMIVKLGMAEKVRSLTTIGTPHLGTILADRMLNDGVVLWLKFLQEGVHLNLEGFRDLTTFACQKFNQEAEDSEAKNDVLYQTYSSFEQGNDMFLPLFPSWFFIQTVVGRNDGLVPFNSQKWVSQLIADDGTKKQITQNEFPIPADHLNQIGWWDWEEAVSPLFGGSFQNQRSNYEGRIKNIYLKIANDLQQI